MGTGPGGGASEDRSAQPSAAGSRRRPRRFSPLERRPPALPPVWRLTLAYVCSLLLHGAVAMDLLRMATLLSRAASGQSEVAWVDLTMSGPAAWESTMPGSAAGATPAVAERSAPGASPPPTAVGPRPDPGRRPIVPPAASPEPRDTAGESGAAARRDTAAITETRRAKAPPAPRRQAVTASRPTGSSPPKANAAAKRAVPSAPKSAFTPPPQPVVPERPQFTAREVPTRVPVFGLPPMPEGEAPEGPAWPMRALDFAKTLIPVPSLESLTPPAIAPPEPTSKEPPPPEPVAREPVLLERSARKEIASPKPGPQPASEQPATERPAPEPPAPVPRPAAPSPPSASTGGPGDGIERASPRSQAAPGKTPRQRSGGATAGVAQTSPEPGGSGVGHATAASSAATVAGAGSPSGATGQREPGSGEAPGSSASATPGPSGSGPGSRGGVATRGLRVEFDGPRTRVT